MINEIIHPLKAFIGHPVIDLFSKEPTMSQHKGLAGRLIEQALGATSCNKGLPDLPQWGIEIKTIPISEQGIPLENTFLNKITLPFRETSFEHSSLWAKIKKILWIPLIGHRSTPMLKKIIGYPLLWEPDQPTLDLLKQDWYELTSYLRLGDFDQINSQVGELLHIRPKAANSDEKITLKLGNSEQSILPIGFYLRKTLTQKIIESNYVF
jgi:DNA mismatch repair protein MutH